MRILSQSMVGLLYFYTVLYGNAMGEMGKPFGALAGLPWIVSLQDFS
jgi:hypothetical protein